MAFANLAQPEEASLFKITGSCPGDLSGKQVLSLVVQLALALLTWSSCRFMF